MVTGTNGKTSTSNMIADLLEHAGRHVISNRRGDNMRAGVATAILTHSTLRGKVKGDAMVLEVDELNVRHLLPQLPVNALVVTNFFRDQLDRAREMEQLIATIEQAIGTFAGTLVLNANDPNVMRLADHAPAASVFTFGVDRNAASTKKTQEASEGKFCPRCGAKLTYSYYQYSHIGVYIAADVIFTRQRPMCCLHRSICAFSSSPGTHGLIVPLARGYIRYTTAPRSVQSLRSFRSMIRRCGEYLIMLRSRRDAMSVSS